MAERRMGVAEGKRRASYQGEALEALHDLLVTLMIPITLPSLAVATPSLLLAVLESVLESRLEIEDATRTAKTLQARRRCLEKVVEVLDELLAGVSGWRSSGLEIRQVLAGDERAIEKVVRALVTVAKRKGVIGDPDDELQLDVIPKPTRPRPPRTRNRFGGAAVRPQSPRSAHQNALGRMTHAGQDGQGPGELSTDTEAEARPVRRRPPRRIPGSSESSYSEPFVVTEPEARERRPSSGASTVAGPNQANSSESSLPGPATLDAILAALPAVTSVTDSRPQVVVVPSDETSMLPLVTDDVDRFERRRNGSVEPPPSAPSPVLSDTPVDITSEVSDVLDSDGELSDSDDPYMRVLKLRKAFLLRRIRQLSPAPTCSSSTVSALLSEETPKAVRVAVRRAPRKEVDPATFQKRRFLRSAAHP